MAERPNVVIPSPGPTQRDFVREFRPWWQQAEEKWWGKFVPENVRHAYDSSWRRRIWSIQAACDRRGPWKYVALLFYISLLSFVFPLLAAQLVIGTAANLMFGGVIYVVFRLFKLTARAADDY